MEIAFLVGRIIVGLYFLYNAIGGHLLGLNMLSQYAASRGVPAPTAAVLVTGTLLLAGGLSILTGYRPLFGVIALVLFFLPVTFWMHNFWAETDPMARMGQMVNFTKNLALLGSALMFLAIPQPWPYSLGK